MTDTLTNEEGLSKPDSASGQLQRAILKILYEHEQQPDGLPTSARFIFYELVQRGIIEKKPKGARGRRSDQNMHDALFYLRDRDVVPWDWIVDETRNLTRWSYSVTIADYLIGQLIGARIDVWDGEPSPMILTESRSLAGVLQNVASQYLAFITATNGQVGGFLRTDVAPALEPGQCVLYLGDWDWQGHQIEDNTRTVLEQLVGGELDWKRIALTEEQVNRYDLPRLLKEDKRYDEDSPHRWHEAVETEALNQQIIVDIVRRRLNTMLPKGAEGAGAGGAEPAEAAGALALAGQPLPRGVLDASLADIIFGEPPSFSGDLLGRQLATLLVTLAVPATIVLLPDGADAWQFGNRFFQSLLPGEVGLLEMFAAPAERGQIDEPSVLRMQLAQWLQVFAFGFLSRVRLTQSTFVEQLAPALFLIAAGWRMGF